MTRTILTPEDAMAQAAALIEVRRSKHADFRMEADDPAGDPDPGNDPAGDPPAEKTPEEQLAEALAAVEEWKGHARKHEQTAKARKAAADELARLKAASATPDEQRAAAEKERDDARRELAKYRVAAETGVPADLIAGEDEDSMRTFAEALKAFRGETPAAKTTPRPDPSQGPKAPVKKTAAEIARAEYERRHPTKKN